MRDVTPAMATRKLYGCTALQEHPRKVQRLNDDADKSGDPGSNPATAGNNGLSVRDRMLVGIRMGFFKQRASECDLALSLRNAVTSLDDPRSILHGLDAHAPTVATAQRAITERLGIKSNQSIQQDLNDINETKGLSEMVHPDMSAFDTNDGQFRNFEHFVYREPHM